MSTDTTDVRRILRLAGPFALSNVIGLGAQFAVLAMIGWIGDDALYVRSVYMPSAFLFLAVQVGMGAATQVAVARCVGRGERDAIAAHLSSMLRIGLLGYLAVGALTVAAAAGPVLGGSPEHRPQLVLFLLAMTVAGLFALSGDQCAAVLRGMGVGSAAIVLTVVFAVINVGVVAVLAFGVHIGLTAVPVGVAVAGGALLVVALVLLRRRGVRLDRSTVSWRPEVMKLVRLIALPVAGSYLVLFVVNTVMLHIVSRSGEYAVAGFASGYTIQTAAIVPGIGFGSAIAVLMNQQRAAGHAEWAMATYRKGVMVVVACYAAVTLAIILLGRRLAESLSANPEIVEHAWRYLSVVGPTFGCSAIVLAVLTVLEHNGRGPVALGSTIAYFTVVTVVGALAVSASGDVGGLYRTIAIAAVISAITAPPIVHAALAPRRWAQAEPSTPVVAS